MKFNVGVFLILFVIGCGNKPKNEGTSPSKPNDMPVAISAFVAQNASIGEAIALPGTLVANEEVIVKSEISGKITKVSFQEGSQVSKGQLLFKIFDSDLQAQLKKLKVQKELLVKTLNRQKELRAVNAVSMQEYDNTESQMATIDADIQLVEVQISKTELVAPFNGKAGLRMVSEGAQVNVGEPLTTIQQVNTLKLDVNVPERYAPILKHGLKLKFSEPNSSLERIAEVYAIDTKADPQTRNIRIRSLVDNKENQLHPGQFVQVSLGADNKSQSLVIPTQSVIPEAKGKKVIRIKAGKAEFMPITIGIRTEKYVEVLSGLQLGDTVAVTGIMKLRPDSKVIIKELTNSK